MAGPIDDVYVDGVPVQKGSVRADDKTGHRRTMASVNDVRNADLTGQFGGIYVRSVKAFYDIDTENLDADDGDEVIIDVQGNHFVKLDLGSGGGDVAGDTHAAPSKATPADADELPLVDSAASNVLKKLTWANLKTTLAAWLVSAGWIRERLSANRTYYVRTDGSDSNNGLANTTGGAFLTLQKAYNVILTLDLNGFTVTVQLADGTYTSGLNQTASPVGGNIAIVGNTTTPANVVISESTQPAIGLVSPINLTLSGLTLQTSGSANNRCISAAGAAVNVSIGTAVVFGTCSGSHIYCNRNALVSLDNDYIVSGGATRHYTAQQGGVISGTGRTITVSGTPAFSSSFAEAILSGVLQVPGITYSGSATGSRYNAASGGVINTNSGNTSYFPGNASGTGTNFSASPWGLYL